MKTPLLLLLTAALCLVSCKKESRPDTWQPVPLVDKSLRFFGRITFGPGGAGWITGGLQGKEPGNFILLRTTDAGASWQTVDLGPVQVSGFNTISPLSRTSVYASGPDRTETGQFNRRIYHSADGGLTWTKRASTNLRTIFDLKFFTEQTGLALSSDVIQRTDDGGDTWRMAHTGSIGLSILRFINPQVGYAAGGIFRDGINAGTLLRTDDGGLTWRDMGWPHGSIEDIYFAPGGKGNLMTITQLYTSTDGGLSWQPIPSPLDYVTESCFTSPQVGYYGGADGIWGTGDAGRNWRREYDAVRTEFGPGSINSVAVSSDNVPFAVTGTGLILKRNP